MSGLRQAISILGVNLLGLRKRLGSSAVAILGVAGVVLVFVGVLSMAAGFRQTVRSTATGGNILILQSGSDNELVSSIPGEAVDIIAGAPGIVEDEQGPLISPEVVTVVDLPRKDTGAVGNVVVRGVEPVAFRLREGFELVEGMMPDPGHAVLVAGTEATRQFAGLEMFSPLDLGGTEWFPVGVFRAGGTYESEIWADARTLQSTFRRGRDYQSVRVRVATVEDFRALRDYLENDPRLNVRAVPEVAYFAEQSAVVSNLITGLGLLVALLMALGAAFGAVNTMYSAVQARKREIATLRALGFRGGPVVLSVLAESMLLALVGGVLGMGLAYVLFDGVRTSTLNWSSFSQVAFAFAVTPSLLVGGAFLALAIGLVGGLLPAIRAARLPVSQVLREL